MRVVCASQPKWYAPWGVTGTCYEKAGFGVPVPGMAAKRMPHLLSDGSHREGMRMKPAQETRRQRPVQQGGTRWEQEHFLHRSCFVSRMKLSQWSPISCVLLEHKGFSCNSTSNETLPIGLDLATLLDRGGQCQYESPRFSYFIHICDIWTNSILPKDCPPIPWLL